jgi:hypothetical protein
MFNNFFACGGRLKECSAPRKGFGGMFPNLDEDESKDVLIAVVNHFTRAKIDDDYIYVSYLFQGMECGFHR